MAKNYYQTTYELTLDEEKQKEVAEAYKETCERVAAANERKAKQEFNLEAGTLLGVGIAVTAYFLAPAVKKGFAKIKSKIKGEEDDVVDVESVDLSELENEEV